MGIALKNFILHSPRIMKGGAFIYNLLTFKIFYPKKIGILKCICLNTHFKVNQHSYIKIGLGSLIKNCNFIVTGKNSRIILGNKCKIKNTNFICEDDNSCIIIDDNFTMEGGEIASTEGGKITIGKDCMVSYNVDIRNGDSHAIYKKETGQRINSVKNIIIKEHVWISGNATILKGAEIENNCIIANSALVTHKLTGSNCIYGGIPAKLLKEGVIWTRKRDKENLF